jgi:hypothetical protein
MLAHQGTYGIVTHLSRTHRVARPTLYAWRERAHQALLVAFTPPALPPTITPVLERHVLTVWVSAHASTRGIQTCLRSLSEQGISLATSTSILHTAQQRAIAWMHSHTPESVRALALDEIYANHRRGAYLNALDVHSGAVWASEGPLAVDADSWTLLLWSLRDRGLEWDRVVLDGRAAMQAACRSLTPAVIVQGDQWHVLQHCAQLQARLDREQRNLQQQSGVVERQAARLAAGQRPKGRRPKTDLAAHLQDVALATQITEGVRTLLHELHRLLEVDARERQAELISLLRLLAELAAAAAPPQQAVLLQLERLLQDRLPQLLSFVPHLEQVQRDLRAVLLAEQQALVGWAWLRRQALGWTSRDILAAIPADWRSAARVLLASWDDAVRVSSAVERWHSILRPHLAVHRSLTTGMLALLAVWHNHRVFTRGVHKGKSPLHLSGMTEAPTDWLVALGYPPAEDVTPQIATFAQAA